MKDNTLTIKSPEGFWITTWKENDPIESFQLTRRFTVLRILTPPCLGSLVILSIRNCQLSSWNTFKNFSLRLDYPGNLVNFHQRLRNQALLKLVPERASLGFDVRQASFYFVNQEILRGDEELALKISKILTQERYFGRLRDFY